MTDHFLSRITCDVCGDECEELQCDDGADLFGDGRALFRVGVEHGAGHVDHSGSEPLTYQPGQRVDRDICSRCLIAQPVFAHIELVPAPAPDAELARGVVEGLRSRGLLEQVAALLDRAGEPSAEEDPR